MNEKIDTYDNEFFKRILATSLPSANIIIPMAIELVKPKSVIDIGCGIGAFLSCFRENGIEDILGIDGDYVDLNNILIPRDKFSPYDLSKKYNVGRKFDLAVSLEVAEHIQKESAEVFIDNLVNLSDVILFSAAIPGQGGTSHVNEQWPTYWAEIFKKRGYYPVDCLRKKIWDKPEVSWWYKQNIMFFVKEECLNNYGFEDQYIKKNFSQLSLVHPELWQLKANLAKSQSKMAARIKNFIKTLFGK